MPAPTFTDSAGRAWNFTIEHMADEAEWEVKKRREVYAGINRRTGQPGFTGPQLRQIAMMEAIEAHFRALAEAEANQGDLLGDLGAEGGR